MSLKRLLKCSGLVYIGKKKLNTGITSWPYLILLSYLPDAFYSLTNFKVVFKI